MHAYLPPPEPVTPAWLTTILRTSPALTSGDVAGVAIHATGAFNSRTRRLDLVYSADAVGRLPAQLILKQPIPEQWAQEAGLDEVRFYQLVTTLDPSPPAIVPCYGAAFDPDSGDSYLLLEDLSAMHTHPVSREQQIGLTESVPADDAIWQVVEALARHHAYWWNHPTLRTDVFHEGYWSRNAERFQLYLERRRASWNRLLAGAAGWLPNDVRELYEAVLDRLERHWSRDLEPRFRSNTHLTLIHGDSYFSNFLCPRPGVNADTFLIDWQSPTVDLAGYDLANLVATFWTPEQRHEAQREQRILQHYYAALVAHGVQDYRWEDLLADYRAGLIYWLLVPVQDAGDGSSEGYWWPKMQCLMAAFQDWECAALLR
jgi:thiamine kinase-like enzyme